MNPELATETVLSWSPLLPGWGLVLAGGLAAALLFASWRNTRGVWRGRRALLVGLRVVALIILAAVLGGPESVHTEGRKVRDPFVVLLDASRSMRVEDASGGSRASQVSGWLRSRSAEFDALREDYDLRFFLVGEELTEWTPSSPSTGDGASQAPDLRPSETAARGGELLQDGDYCADSTSTDLGQALFGLRDQLGQGKPAGVLLASDGADRAALGRALASRGPEAVEELAAGLDFPVTGRSGREGRSRAALRLRATTVSDRGRPRQAGTSGRTRRSAARGGRGAPLPARCRRR